jgi:hypothetical protein
MPPAVGDTLLTTGPVSSLLSVQPQHRRGWGSLNDALAVREVSVQRLERLLVSHPVAGGEPIYAVEVSVWPRCDAETSPERALYYHASRHSAGQPIVAGWAYSWIAQLRFAHESWTAPLRVRRLRPQENANAVAAEQIAAFLPHLPIEGPLPWFLFDAGDDPVQLTQALSEARAAILIRLRAGRCFSADPTAPPRTGRPRRHEHQFACDAPRTWLPPDGKVVGRPMDYYAAGEHRQLRLHNVILVGEGVTRHVRAKLDSEGHSDIAVKRQGVR